MLNLKDYLREDVGRGDLTSSLLFARERARAVIRAEKSCILAGSAEAAKLFRGEGLRVWAKRDGSRIRPREIVLRADGKARSILKVERVALNFLMRMSGIATETRRVLVLARGVNPKVQIAGTRKTVPGFRAYDKKAIQLGGGWPHRQGLYDRILIKENHLGLVSVKEAIRRAKKARRVIEVEAEDLETAMCAARAGAQEVLLDNMSPKKAGTVFRALKSAYPNLQVEVSGGITRRNVARYARYADRLSLGYLTHSVRAIHFSLDLQA